MGFGILGKLVGRISHWWRGDTGNLEGRSERGDTDSQTLVLLPEERVDEGGLVEEVRSLPVPGLAKREKKRNKGKLVGKEEKHTDKNAIPILTDKHNLVEIFGGLEGEKQRKKRIDKEREGQVDDTVKEDFGDLFQESQTAQYHIQMLAEKKEACIKEDTATLRVWELFKEYPLPQVELDLHGYTSAQAAAGVEKFIQEGVARGLMTIRLITGKGVHSQGKAVLPDVVENTVVMLKRKKRWILGYQWEKKDKRKSGALVVYLIPGK